MQYVRRKPYATSFAWPPTREDLDLIEVVDADTLCPIHARCDEPEPQPPEPPVLLKSVTPVRPIVTPGIDADLPVLVSPPQPAPAMPSSAMLARSGWRRVSAHVDANWLIAAGAAFAVSLSAYLSLRAAPSVSASDFDPTLGAPSRPAPHLIVSTFAPFAPNWAMPIAATTPKPPVATRTASKPEPRAAASAAVRERLQPPAHAGAQVAATRLQPTLQPQRPAPSAASVLALNTRHSPFLSNVIASMPSAPAAHVPTIRPAIETHAAPAPSATAAAARTDGAPARPLVPMTSSDSAHSAPASTAANERARSGALTTRQADATGSDLAHGAPAPSATAAAARTDAATARPIVPMTSGDSGHGAPAPTAASEHARGGVPSQQVSQQQVYAALKEYERAYEQLDAKAVRAVWPSVDARALERAFHDLKSQTLVFDRCEIDVARGSQAVAACRGRATYETRAGQQAARSEPREWTFTLQKSDEAWRIVSANAR